MPAPTRTIPPVAHYEPAPETSEEIEYAAMPIIDFSKAHTAEGRAALAPQVRDAMRTCGFMCVVNHGLTQAQNDRMVDVADVPFSAVPADEQTKFQSNTKEDGNYRGYKPRQYWHIENGVRDQIHRYGVVRPGLEQEHPAAVQPYVPEIHAFMEHNQFNVLYPILRLLALGLELPEETFVKQHKFEAEGMTYLCFSKYFPRTAEEEAKTKNVWMKGHTDRTTITLLWNQPVVALQIMGPDGKWRYVKYIPNSILVNAGSAMELLSGGYYKANIHRVFQPPPDQQGYTRLLMVYFAYADDDVRLALCKDQSSKESPVLQRAGIAGKCADEDAPTMKEWRSLRARAYGSSGTERKENGEEELVLNGTVLKYFNALSLHMVYPHDSREPQNWWPSATRRTTY